MNKHYYGVVEQLYRGYGGVMESRYGVSATALTFDDMATARKVSDTIQVLVEDELATANAALTEQSQALALARQNADAAAELLRIQSEELAKRAKIIETQGDVMNEMRQHNDELIAVVSKWRQALTELASYAHGMIGYANSYPVDGVEFEALEERIKGDLSLAEVNESASAESEESE